MGFFERKRNRLQSFDYSLNGAYFITICTNKRAKILSNIIGDASPVLKTCGKIALNVLGKISEKYPSVSVDNWVIMPDHIHMLIRLNAAEDHPANENLGTGNPSPTLGQVIAWYKYETTKQINAKFSHSPGRVFQRSYYDHIIRNQLDYNECWDYIDKNPQQWITDKEDGA